MTERHPYLLSFGQALARMKTKAAVIELWADEAENRPYLPADVLKEVTGMRDARLIELAA